MSGNPAPRNDDRFTGAGLLLTVVLAVTLSACKPESETGGLGGATSQAGQTSEAPLLSEPPVPTARDRGARKQFDLGRRAVLSRDYGRARAFILDALRRHESQGGSATDEFGLACLYYQARVQEGLLEFDEALSMYEKIPEDSRLRPYALRRLMILSRDTDSDGYIDAWEEAEGSNPNNPLSHP